MELLKMVTVITVMMFIIIIICCCCCCCDSADPAVCEWSDGSKCVGPQHDAATFCSALVTCTSLGQRLLRPHTYRDIKDSGLLTDDTWVAVTDALHERGTDKTGWLVVPGHEIFTDTELWPNNQPSGDGEDCVRHAHGKLADVSCSNTFAFRCEFPVNASTQSDSRQHTTAIFASTSVPGFTQDSVGCNQVIEECPDTRQCALNCRVITAGCIGFYHNRLRRQCILLMHFDATVQLAYNSDDEKRDWTKMIQDLTTV